MNIQQFAAAAFTAGLLPPDAFNNSGGSAINYDVAAALAPAYLTIWQQWLLTVASSEAPTNELNLAVGYGAIMASMCISATSNVPFSVYIQVQYETRLAFAYAGGLAAMDLVVASFTSAGAAAKNAGMCLDYPTTLVPTTPQWNSVFKIAHDLHLPDPTP